MADLRTNHMVKIYTKRGDQGETGLLYGGRVSKTDPRCEAYGTIDEAVSALGLARSLSANPRVKKAIRQLQRELFTVGAELATAADEYETLKKHFAIVTPEMVEWMENLLDDMEEEVKLPRAFIIPGASAASSAIDVARSTLRRAERRTVELKELGLLVNDEVLRYLNRAADLLFMLARYEDRTIPQERLTANEE
ncbi:MAG: cob(I)yrinic acid a,c-diamide adenosyltransferase [Chloroflexi bacterium]|nr:cob(I)yrinic acid a,c-diamide adenosyltransferase [Chloroflexota bacterium]